MLVDLYAKRIYNLAYQFSGTPQEAEDLVQDIFFKLYNSLGKYEPEKDFSAWFLTLARTEKKRMKNRSAVPLEEVTNAYSSGSYSTDHNDPALMRNVRAALKKLHPRYRIPVILKDVEGFSQEEIARMLKLPVGTVKARISRGREYIRKWLEEGQEIKNRPDGHDYETKDTDFEL